jgi:SAM-dependent methyltransferase
MAFSSLGNIFGIDVSSQGVSFCASRGLKNIAQCTANKIPFKDKTFDMVIYLDVLQYLPEPTEALFESRRILKDNGKIIITVPAFRILWSQHDETFSYLRRYEKHSLLEEIEEAGLKVERMNYLFFASFLVVAPIRIIREFLLPRKEKVQSDTITLPPEPVNRFLKFLFNIETKVSMHFRLPFGTTLYAIVSKGKN